MLPQNNDYSLNNLMIKYCTVLYRWNSMKTEMENSVDLTADPQKMLLSADQRLTLLGVKTTK